MPTAAASHVTNRVAILLSTYNGERFLGEQLDSLVGQTFQDWRLYWRDDGSHDGTCRLMADFLGAIGCDRSVAVPCAGRLGASESFLHLIRVACADGNDIIAFADQDDVWLPQKLAAGVAALTPLPQATPALYCARQVLVDASLRRVALSATLRRPPGFPAALTQNIATGCTIMLNRAAANLVAASQAPGGTMHDWWCYLVVAAAGGRLLFDDTPMVLYRQHDGNAIGAPSTVPRRALGALRRGPTAFMTVLQENVSALAEQPHLLSETAREDVARIAQAMNGSVLRRLSVLRMRGLARQTWPETMLFRLWFVLH